MANARDRASVNEHVEFVVKAAEDLILEGKERSLVRVRAGTPYSCLMLKNQRFSSLFRHYAKHHGLRKEDLAYYFTEPLQNEDTPETVFMQPRDEVIVRKRSKHETDNEQDDSSDDPKIENEKFVMQIGSLLEEGEEHCDVTFFAGEQKAEIRAHKVVLMARSDYFRNMFRSGSLKECSTNEVHFECHDEQTVRWMLEYIYTNRIADLQRCNADQFAALLSIAEEYQLLELKRICEHAACGNITVSNVARLLSAAEQFHAPKLKSACMLFVQINMGDCAYSQAFCNDICSSPRLCISILKHISGEGKGSSNFYQIGGSNSSSSSSSGIPNFRQKRRRIDIEVDAEDERRYI